jgi:hypothetical protein
MRLRTSPGPTRGRSRRPLGAVPAPPPAPLGTNQPTLADLAPYAGVSVGGYTRYENVPWGALFGVAGWNEPTLNGQLVQPVMTIYMPNTPAPAGGYGMILRAHANGADHNIEEGTGSLWANLVVPAMTGGYGVCSIEFRHPVPNVALGAPHLDAGYCVQFARALGPALNLNQNRFHAYATSRGNLVFWQAVAPELADPGSPAFAKRQSSRVKAVYGVQTQDSFSTTQFIQQKVVPADQAACLADPAYADDPRWGSAQDLIRNGQQPLPYLCAVYDQPFVNALPSHVMGRYTKAQIDADPNLRVHCPEFARGIWDAFATRGRTDLITVCDEVSGGVATTADAVGFFTAIDTQPGISAKAAKCQAQQRRLGGPLYYFEGASPSGAYASQSTPTPVTTAGATFGVLIDGAWGRDNRLNTSAPLGATMVQNTAAARPTLTPINRGLGWGFSLDAVDDVFRVGLANASVDVLSFPVLEAPVQGFTTRGTGQFTLGADKVGAKTLSLIAAVPNTVFTAVDAKFLRQFALELSGEDQFGALDKVTAAGGRYLLDDRTRYVRPGLSFARAQQVFGVQADGSLAAYTGSQVPWEDQGVRLDPGWSQRLLWTHDLSNAAWTKNLCTLVGSKVVPNTSSGDHFVNNNSTVAAAAGDVVTITAHVKPDGYNWVRLSAGNTAGGVNFSFFDLVNGVVGVNSGNTASIRKLADGSSILSVTRVASASGPIGATVYVVPADNTFSWAGDGVRGVQVLSANLTNTSYSTPLTIATNAAVTVPNFSFAGLNADMAIALGGEYTIGMEYEVINRVANQFPPVAQLRVGATGGSNVTTGFFVHPNGSQFAIVRNTADIYMQQSGASGLTRSVLRVKDGAFRAASNGVLAAAGASGVQPSGLTAIQIGRDGAGAVCAAMYIKKLWIAPTGGLTDAQVQDLSTL